MDKSGLWRVFLIYFAFLLFALFVIGKIVYIQIYEKEDLQEFIEKNEQKKFVVMAARGNVLSKDDSPLAITIPTYDIFFDTQVAQDSVKYKEEKGKFALDDEYKKLADSLAVMLGKYDSKTYLRELKKAKAQKNRYYKIAGKLTLDEYRRISKFPIFKLNKFEGGFIAEKRYTRELPYGTLAKRTIGYVREGKDSIYVGLEGAYNKYLTGVDGVEYRRRINGGTYIPVESSYNIPAKDGCDICTTIDVDVQDIVEKSLAQCLAENKAEQGCVIIMDVKTGYIEAISSLKYDEKTGEYDEKYNFAIAELVEPGSTFKAATMLALLENDPNFDVNRVINTGAAGVKYFHGHALKDSHVVNKGTPTIRQAFEHSSNIAMAQLVEEAFIDNPQCFIDLLYKSCINVPLNLSLKGGGKAYIKTTDSRSWSKLSLPWMAMGYELQLTPMHILTFYNAIANDGVMMKPQFVREIRDGKDVIETFPPVVISDSIASPKNIRMIQELLRGVVKEGTAKSLNDLSFSVAGKTGTAQIAQGKSGYANKRYTATFVGFFPYENPKYSCIVMVSNPKGGAYYGSMVSAPVFKEVAKRVYANKIPDTDNVFMQSDPDCEVYAETSMAYLDDVDKYCDLMNIDLYDTDIGTEWVKVKRNINGYYVEPVNVNYSLVPDFTGMNVTDAVFLIESLGWKAQFEGHGRVLKQSVEPDEELEKGKTIKLVLGYGKKR